MVFEYMIIKLLSHQHLNQIKQFNLDKNQRGRRETWITIKQYEQAKQDLQIKHQDD